MIAKSERFELRLDPDTLDRIDVWRSEQRDLPSRSAAVRRLVEAGLTHGQDERLFEMARFNVLVAARAGQPLDKAYAYAWDRGVYPLFHDGAHLHQPFAAHFTVSKDMTHELAKYLDDRDLANEVPSFYELESYYDVRSGRTDWDRMGLITTCRYMFLDGRFGEKFWGALLRGSDHPAEAKSITDSFDPERDIFLN